jgi:hypothetical protein
VQFLLIRGNSKKAKAKANPRHSKILERTSDQEQSLSSNPIQSNPQLNPNHPYPIIHDTASNGTASSADIKLNQKPLNSKRIVITERKKEGQTIIFARKRTTPETAQETDSKKRKLSKELQ